MSNPIDIIELFKPFMPKNKGDINVSWHFSEDAKPKLDLICVDLWEIEFNAKSLKKIMFLETQIREQLSPTEVTFAYHDGKYLEK